MMEWHGGEKARPCPQCDKTFLSKVNLASHIRRVHSGHRSFRCNGKDEEKGCGKTFKRKDGLTKHQTDHCGKSPLWPQKIWEELSGWQKSRRAKAEWKDHIEKSQSYIMND